MKTYNVKFETTVEVDDEVEDFSRNETHIVFEAAQEAVAETAMGFGVYTYLGFDYDEEDE